MKYEVWYETWDETWKEAEFNTKAEAEKYIKDHDWEIGDHAEEGYEIYEVE